MLTLKFGIFVSFHAELWYAFNELYNRPITIIAKYLEPYQLITQLINGPDVRTQESRCRCTWHRVTNPWIFKPRLRIVHGSIPGFTLKYFAHYTLRNLISRHKDNIILWQWITNVSKICMGDYVPDTYRNAKFHYYPIRQFCPPHMWSCLLSVHSVTFLGSENTLSPKPLSNFDAQCIKRRRFMQRCAFWGSRKQNFTLWPYFSQKAKIFRPFSMGLRKFWLKTGFKTGTSSVNTTKMTSYAFGSWMLTRKIDPHKSKYDVSFYPGSRLTGDSACARRIQPRK